MKLSSLPLFSEKSLVKGLVFLNLSLLYKGQNDSYNKFNTTKNYAGNDDMTKKEKEIYPRSRKEMLRIIKTAEKEGHLLETALEEFTIHPFSMPALWDCREYILGIGQKNITMCVCLRMRETAWCRCFPYISRKSGRMISPT